MTDCYFFAGMLQFVTFLFTICFIFRMCMLTFCFFLGSMGFFRAFPSGQAFAAIRWISALSLTHTSADFSFCSSWQLKRPARKTKDSSGVRAHASAATRRSIRSGTPAHSASVLFCTYARAHKCNFTLKTGTFYKKGEI